MASSTPSPTKNIVIVGGGFGGMALFTALSPKLSAKKYNDYNLIVVNSRPFFTHLPGVLRMLVTDEGKLEDQVLMQYPEKSKGKGEFVTGTVVRIQPASESDEGGKLVLADETEISYSVLVLATGTTWNGLTHLPEGREEIKQHANEWREKFSQAKNVVLVGGGAVGVELAGEVKEYFPDKPVTLVHGQPLLFNGAYPDKWRKDVGSRLKQINVDVVLDDFLDSVEVHEGEVETRKGKKISADLVIATLGGKPNTQLIADSLGADALTKEGFVEIEKTLQVKNHPRVFALGDIINWSEQKQAAKCKPHAAIVAANVLSLVDGKKATTEYKGTFEAIFVSIGKSRGAAYLNVLWGITVGNSLVKLAKSQNLIIDMMRSQYGLGKLE